MPVLTNETFPNQIKTNYQTISEFFNISYPSKHLIWKNFVFSRDYFIFVIIKLNKILIFLEKKKIFALCNVIRNDSTKTTLLKLSNSGSKFSFVIRKKVIVIFKLSEKFLGFAGKSRPFFFKKVLEFSCESEKAIDLISSCFNNEEDCIFLSLSNGKILFLNLDGKITSIFKVENPLLNLNPGTGMKSKTEFYGIFNHNSLLVYNFLTLKSKLFKEGKLYFIKEDFIIVFQRNSARISCKCHGISLKNFFFPTMIAGILPVENDQILIWGKNSIYFITVGFLTLKTTKFYHFEKTMTSSNFSNYNLQRMKLIYKGTFSVLVLLKSQNFVEIKPLTEKNRVLVNTKTILLKNNQINSVKFFGKKNSIIIGNNSDLVNILNGNCFKFIGTFSRVNLNPVEIIIKNKFLIISSNHGEVFIYNLNSALLIERICYSEKFSIEFVINSEKESQCFLISGCKNGNLKTWNLVFHDWQKTELKLAWIKKITNDSIVSVSSSCNAKFLALLTKKKKIFLLNFEKLNFLSSVEIPEKKVCCVKFCPKNNILCIGTEYGAVIFYNIFENKILKVIKGERSSVLTVEFNNKGSILMAGFSDGIIKVISVYSSTVYRILGNHSKPVWSCGFSNDEKIVSGCSGGQLIILKDVSKEISIKQIKKLSRIFYFKKILKIEPITERFDVIFKRLVFAKNPFMLIDFIEFSYKKSQLTFHRMFSRVINLFKVQYLNFTIKSLILWIKTKKKQILPRKLILIFFENLRWTRIKNLNPSILKAAFKIIEEWAIDLRKFEKLVENIS